MFFSRVHAAVKALRIRGSVAHLLERKYTSIRGETAEKSYLIVAVRSNRDGEDIANPPHIDIDILVATAG